MNFYEFPIPAQINGVQLKAELKCDEVYVRDGKLIIGGTLTRQQAEAGLAAHTPTPVAVQTVADKLAKFGLTVAELRAAVII